MVTLNGEEELKDDGHFGGLCAVAIGHIGQQDGDENFLTECE
jgi:hypothetical protein